MSLTVVILTMNEARHIARAIQSVQAVAEHIVVVDSGSTDDTRAIAAALGATVLQNPWINYAAQFNWALDHMPAPADWVLRLDADEIVSLDLRAELASRLPALPPSVVGVNVSRRMTFLRRPIRHGGVFPIRVLRLFRHGQGRCENRWMDEHILVRGPVDEFRGEILDDNTNPLGWWTDKHNAYASREVIDMLNLEYGFLPMESVANIRNGQQAGVKRWIKERIYARMPGGLRAAMYFLYRYVVRLGFLDGFEGAAFHILQGFWYRFLVDAKLREVRLCMVHENVDPAEAIHQVLGIRLPVQADGAAA